MIKKKILASIYYWVYIPMTRSKWLLRGLREDFYRKDDITTHSFAYISTGQEMFCENLQILKLS